MLDKVEKLKIAFVTDIHLNKLAMQKLEAWVNEHYNSESKFDYCFVGGDTANCDHSTLSHDEEEMYQATIDTHRMIKNMFSCKVFFVPGNHDCKQFFTPLARNQGFYNMHNRRVELSEGLDLVGFGGSTPGYSNGVAIWSGFPYQDDKQLADQWNKTKMLIDEEKSGRQVILLTHEGPSISETTVDRGKYPDGVVTTGSEFLDQFICRKQIICWFHGHTHEGSKFAKINNIPILNPGPLKNNEFMHFQLTKQELRWRLSRRVFEVL